MSDQDKTLKETISEALDGNNDTVVATEIETDKGISGEDTKGETKSGETPEYVSGIDISDIPETDRPRVKELLLKKAKLLEDGYQGKFKDVATLKKTQDELNSLGLSVDEARDVLVKHIEKKRNPITTTEKKGALRTLDKLIEQAPYEQGQSLEQMRTIIREETEADVIKKRLDSIEKTLGSYQNSAQQTRKETIKRDLSVLSDKYGKELISKYEEVIMERGLQYPDVPVSKILSYEVPLEEIEQAILLKGKKPLTKEKQQANSSSGSGITSASEKIDVKKTSIADILLKGVKK